MLGFFELNKQISDSNKWPKDKDKTKNDRKYWFNRKFSGLLT